MDKQKENTSTFLNFSVTTFPMKKSRSLCKFSTINPNFEQFSVCCHPSEAAVMILSIYDVQVEYLLCCFLMNCLRKLFCFHSGSQSIDHSTWPHWRKSGKITWVVMINCSYLTVIFVADSNKATCFSRWFLYRARSASKSWLIIWLNLNLTLMNRNYTFNVFD